jgi:hypothetical protein
MHCPVSQFDNLRFSLLLSFNMSWQAYVDNNLIGSGQIIQAGIYGLQGGQWAASSGFSVSFEYAWSFIIYVRRPYPW